MPDTTPLVVIETRFDPGQATAGTDTSFAFGVAPWPATVTSVTFTPNAAITGANTNTRAIRVRNKGAAGSGTTVVAELQFDSGVNASAFVEKTIPLSGTAANLQLATGDVLEIFSDSVGTGQADPGGIVRVGLSRN